MRYEDISLRFGDPTPLTRQIAAAIRDAIARGELTGGERLLATQSLARVLKVSQLTVVQAYNLLIADGVVAGDAVRDTFVLERTAIPTSVVPNPGPMASASSLPLAASTPAIPTDSHERGVPGSMPDNPD